MTTVAYQQPVTFTGELAAGAAQAPVPDEPVQIEFEPADQAYSCLSRPARPDPTGGSPSPRRCPAADMPGPFAGDTGLTPASSSPGWGILLEAAHVPAGWCWTGSPVLSGQGRGLPSPARCRCGSNGTWQPFAGMPLTLTMEPYTSTQSKVRHATTSGPDGRFSLTETVSETSAWSVDTSLNDGYWETWFPDYASASYNWIDGVSKTLVTGFSVPARDEAHLAYDNGMYASGAVERWNGTSWAGLAYGWVQLYYRPKVRNLAQGQRRAGQRVRRLQRPRRRPPGHRRLAGAGPPFC